MPPDLESRRRALSQALRAVTLEGQVDALSRRLRDVDARLRAVEALPAEHAVTREAAPVPAEAEVDEEARVAVPKLDFDEVRMSTVAARALFGG